jgi:flavodoxin I
MKSIGIFFGTDSGTTRLIAKKIARALKPRVGDERVAKPVNNNRVTTKELLVYEVLILGTPTNGEGELPGKARRAATAMRAGWSFCPVCRGVDFSGRV